MPENTLDLWSEITWVAVGAVIVLLFALTVALPNRPKVLPGSGGHRTDDSGGSEEIRADGYIDSFAGVIEEAGGGLPPILKLAIPGILLWFIGYLVVGLL